MIQAQVSGSLTGANTDREAALEPDFIGKSVVVGVGESGVAKDKVLVASTVHELVSKLVEAKTAVAVSASWCFRGFLATNPSWVYTIRLRG